MLAARILKTALAPLVRHPDINVRLEFADGSTLGAGPDEADVSLHFKRPLAEWNTLLFGHIGLLESYSIRERQIDYLPARDYVWRWDTDWFWCSKNLYAQNPVVRRLFGPSRLNSLTYTRIMRWNSRWRLKQRLERLFGISTEAVIQDVDIPLSNAAEFLDFFQREIGITPIWICPIRPWDRVQRFDLYPLVPGTTYVNFGFWDRVRVEKGRPPGYLNRKLERKVAQLGGIKSLYSESYYSRDEFWSVYDRQAYQRLKARYDPQGRSKDLYEKCVLRR